MPFELDDLQMSGWELLAFAAMGLTFYLGMRLHLWLQSRKRSPQEPLHLDG